MDDKQYLLTYQSKGKGYGTFAWFFTEEELQEFINTDKDILTVIDAVKIIQMEEVEY